MMKYFYLAALALATVLLLTGCSSTQVHTTPILPETPIIQQDLLEPCEPLPKLEEKEYNQQESFNVLKEWVRLYYDCSRKQEALAELLDNHK